MPIGQINFATIQRTTDVEQYRHQEEAKPLVDQQNIQGQVEQRVDHLQHQVLDPHNSDRAEDDADPREEGKGEYYARKGTRKKKITQQHDEGRVIKKHATSIDIKI
jgi:hypothetical protein